MAGLILMLQILQVQRGHPVEGLDTDAERVPREKQTLHLLQQQGLRTGHHRWSRIVVIVQ
jgi:hypothetical protein